MNSRARWHQRDSFNVMSFIEKDGKSLTNDRKDLFVGN